MPDHAHKWEHDPDWNWGEGTTTVICYGCNGMRVFRVPIVCLWKPCVATWKHFHGPFPGAFDDPDDPEGPPISFRGADPDPAAVRDYNGAAL
jgi:hypothetical protein